MRYCNTEQLIALNEEASNNPHASRALEDSVYERLDPHGFHVFDEGQIGFRMGSTGFVRPTVYMKFTGIPEAIPLHTVDLTKEQWDSLPKVGPSKMCVECEREGPHNEGDYICMWCRLEV